MARRRGAGDMVMGGGLLLTGGEEEVRNSIGSETKVRVL